MAAEFSKEQLDLYGAPDPSAPIVKPLEPTQPLTTKAITPSVDELRAYASKRAQEKGIDPALFLGLIDQESNWNAKARSKAGARGLTQLMPGTAKDLGVDPDDPYQNIDGGAEYLSQQLKRYGGDVQKALAAYNAGPGAVDKHGGIPPWTETQEYVPRVLANAERNRGAAKPAKGPTPWKEVASDPAVQNLADEDFDKLRQTYFEDVIAPEVPTEHVKDVHAAFMEETKRPGMVEKMMQGARDLLSRAAEPGQSGDVLRGTTAPETDRPDATAIDQGFGNMPDLAQPSATQETPTGLNADQVDVIMQGLNKRATEAAGRGEKTFWVEPGERKALRDYLAQLPPQQLSQLSQRQDAAGATVRGLIKGGGDWGEGIKMPDQTLTDGAMVDDYGNTLAATDNGGMSETGKGMATGVVGMKQMAAATGLIGMVNANRAIKAQTDAFDAIDKGEVPDPSKTPFPNQVGNYMRADAAQRAAMREKLAQQASGNDETKAALLDSWKQYQAEIKALDPNTPDFTGVLDKRTAQSFFEWLGYNTGQAIPYSAAALLAGVVGGGIGLAGFGYGTGVGDVGGNILEAGGTPEQAADQQGLAIPYAALEFLGPVGKFVRAPVANMLRGMSKEAIEQTARGFFKSLGREIPKNMVEEFINEAGQEVVNSKGVSNATGGELFTAENAKKWFNAGMAGAAGSPVTTTAIHAGEHIAQKAKGDLEKRQAEVTQPEQAEPDAADPPQPKAKKAKAEPDGRVEPSIKSEPGDVGGPTEPTMEGEAPADLGGRPDPKNKPVPVQARGIADKESHTSTDEPSITDDGPTIGEALAQDEGPTSDEPKLRAGEDVEGVKVESKAEPAEGERPAPQSIRPAEPRAQDAPKTPEPTAQATDPAEESPRAQEEPAKPKRSRLLKDPVAQQEPKAEEAPKTAEPVAQTAEPEKAERPAEEPKPKRSRMLKEERAEPVMAEAKQTEEPKPAKAEQATAQAAQDTKTEQAEQTKAEPADRFDGQYGKGMTTFNARQHQRRLQSEKPELDWKIEPLEEHGPDRYSVVGYPRQQDKPSLASAESQAERQDKEEKQRDRELSNAVSETLTTANAQQQAAAKRVLKHAGPLGISNPKVVLEQVQAAGYQDGPDFGDGPELSSPLEMDDLIPERAQLVEDMAKAVAADPSVLPMPASVVEPQPERTGKAKLTAAKPKPIDLAAVRQEILRQAFSMPHIRAALDKGARDHKAGNRRLEAIIGEMRDLMGGPKTYTSRLPAMGDAARRTRAGSPHEAVAHPTRAGHWVVQPIVNRPVILNPEVRTELERMARNAGWAEKGGRMIREGGEDGGTGPVVGRTMWIPKEDWWAQRGVNLNEEQTRKAVRKALDGEPLGSREQKLIDYMTRVAHDTVSQVETAAGQLDEQGVGAQDLSADDPIALAADLEAAGLSSTAKDIVDHELVAKAMQINPDAVEAIPDSLEPDAFMDRIREIIDEPQSEAQGVGESDAGTPREEPPSGAASDTGVLAEAAQTQKRRLRQPKSLDRINVLVPARTADGEESVVEMQADEALSRLEASLQKMKELLDCLLA